jgi:hypothetical protein
VPTAGIDPRVALASTLQATRTTAVLLGSGLSSAAGIPTGWQVTLDLIRRVAQASGTDTSGEFDAEQWWRQQHDREPGYDVLVSSLAPTDHDRRHLLHRYFALDQRTGEPAQPTPAHRRLAELIARGSIPVVVTTNFDQLLEHALADAGVAPQILTSASHVGARVPLAHAGFTLVKLHGDYASGRLRNSPDELTSYPQAWKRLLRQIFDEYGLLVAGWSAQYDVALADAMRTTVGRRYAWYWASFRGHLAPEAAVLTTARGAHLIDTDGCDELFADLATQVANLDRTQRRGRTSRPTPAVLAIGHQRPQAWACMPCIVVRAAAVLTNPEPDTAGQLLDHVRAGLSHALDETALTRLVRDLADKPAVSAVPQSVGQPSTPERPDRWAAAPPISEAVHGTVLHPYQTGADAVLRLGGDGASGVSALAEVHLIGSLGASQPIVTVDVGISVADGVTVAAVATVQRAALAAIVDAIVPAIHDVLPIASTIRHVETSWDCPRQFDSTNRPVPERHAIDRTVLGPATRDTDPKGQYAELIDGPTTQHDIIAFVQRAWSTNAINSGYLHAQQPLADMLLPPRAGEESGAANIR